jgi:hypothetical protein
MPEFVIPKLESIKELEGEPLGIIVPATSSHRQRSYPLSMAEYVPLMAFIKRGEGTESDVTYEMADYVSVCSRRVYLLGDRGTREVDWGRRGEGA